MENTQQSEASAEQLPNNWEPVNGQAQPKVYSQEEYANAQAFWTKARQNEIEIAKRLVQKDANELRTLDRELQGKIIKATWWYDDIETLEIMLPTVFNKTETKGWEEWDEDLKQQVKLLKYQMERWNLDVAIDNYKNANKELFNNENAEQLLKEELKYISNELPVDERVRRAAKIALWFTASPTDSAYIKLIEQSTAFVKWWEEENSKQKGSVEEEIASIFKKKHN